MAGLERELTRSLAELRERYLEHGKRLPAGLLSALEADARQGARALARQLRERQRAHRAEGQRLRNLLRFEEELWTAGHLHVAGVDEAGMAPLAGPVVAAAVILPRGFKPVGLDDSKKILDPARREALAAEVRANAVAWAVGRSEVEEIDRINIYHAGLQAMRRAVVGLGVPPDFVLVDARTVPGCPAPQRGIIQGDALSLSIAAASVIAKTTRDALMAELDGRYPGYGLASHKGYPTPQHFAALKQLGASPIHRRSFGPVREALGLGPVQGSLFREPND
ncbi:MAG: ribonuclease HII [Deltaproteobacteria bacterium]|nr:ribonuclease HII [Deltaproteobacteria bacterium]